MDEDDMKIQILMSTYNGEKYIKEQLDSIISQTGVDKTLLIRDDGSSDQTVKIIKDYQKMYPWISYYKGINIGVQNSFFNLIARANSDFDYTAFADQDDMWLPGKLERAVMVLTQLEQQYGENLPILYCGAQILTDEKLRPIHATVSRTVCRPSFGNALVQNICTGCTAVGNKALIEMLKQYPPVKSEWVIMHDWWLYLTASCFGNVYYDQTAYIKYRQHGQNAFGAKLNHRELFRYRIKELFKPRGEIFQQAEAFMLTYESELADTATIFAYQKQNMHADQEIRKNCQEIKKFLNARDSFGGRLSVAVDRTYFRQKYSDDLIFRGIILLGKL